MLHSAAGQVPSILTNPHLQYEDDSSSQEQGDNALMPPTEVP